ncbi:MAG: hypothetical protein K9G64_03490 [Bacteroidia bacterium]|nr:hypothetical protein [Bacteroidia bacterium]
MGDKEVQEAIESIGLTIELIEEHYPRIFEPLGKPSQLELTPREFFYWTDKGVIDIPKAEEGQSPWSRLNLIEILWIRIIKELRKFNLPFASLAILKNDMFSSALIALRENHDLTQAEIEKRYNDPILKNLINKILTPSDNEVEAFIEENKLLFSLITGIVFEILLFRRNINLLVYTKEKNFAFTLEGLKNQDLIQDEIDQAKRSTHLILNLRNLVAEYLVSPELEQLNGEFGFVTEDEKQLIEVIRDKLVKEIHIKKDDNEVLTYIATSKREIKDDQVAAIKRLLRMNEFDDVRVVLRNDKHLYIENKKKIKIRPDKTAQKTNKN